MYTQLYRDYFSDRDPATVNFFDESGFQLPDAGHRNFGFSPVGEECVDVRCYLSTANKTLNFRVGLANMLEGASNSYEFLRFSMKLHKQKILLHNVLCWKLMSLLLSIT